MYKKISLILLLNLILTPIFFLQSKFVLAKGQGDTDSDSQNGETRSIGAIGTFFAKLRDRAYCGISRLFSSGCELRGTAAVSPVPTAMTPRAEALAQQVVTETQTIVERVVQPIQTVVQGVTFEYLETRLAQLREELALTSNIQRTSSGGGSSGSRNLFSKQVDSIYEDMGDRVDTATDGFVDEAEVLSLISANSTSLPAGTTGHVLQKTATSTQWVATSTLGITLDLDSLDPIEIGNGNTASGYHSSFLGPTHAVAVGSNNVATGTAAQVFGALNTASGFYAIAFGLFNTSSGSVSTASGYYNVSSANNTNAFGESNVASDTYASAFGSSNVASGQSSGAFGYNNQALGLQSAAFGNGNEATDENASAFGVNNDATNDGALAFGRGNTASGFRSSAFGHNNTASALYSTSFGSNLTNAVAYSMEIGAADGSSIIVGTSTGSSVTFNGYGAGTLSTNGSGVITSSSDERLKDISGEYLGGLEELRNIETIMYKWKEDTQMADGRTYVGFSAQNIRDIIPEAVDEDGRGFLSLQDRPILALLVNAVKEIAEAVGEINNWFDFKDNNKFCVDEVCISRDEFKEMLRDYGGADTETVPEGGWDEAENDGSGNDLPQPPENLSEDAPAPDAEGEDAESQLPVEPAAEPEPQDPVETSDEENALVEEVPSPEDSDQGPSERGSETPTDSEGTI